MFRPFELYALCRELKIGNANLSASKMSEATQGVGTNPSSVLELTRSNDSKEPTDAASGGVPNQAPTLQSALSSESWASDPGDWEGFQEHEVENLVDTGELRSGRGCLVMLSPCSGGEGGQRLD